MTRKKVHDVEDMTIDRFVEVARELRRAADAAEYDFIDLLRKAEACEQMWSAKAPTFDRVLKKYDICEPARYRDSARALGLFPEQVVRSIGVQAARQAARVPEDRRGEAIEDMVARAEKSHVPLSKQQAREVVKRFVPSQSKALNEKREVVALRAENKKLRRKLREAERTIAKLRRELGEKEAA